MKLIKAATIAVSMAVAAGAAYCEPLKLKPASPQPSGLKAGLAVDYAWLGRPPRKINSVTEAKQLLQASAAPGRPLRGLDYRDTNKGDPVMTHPEHYNVAADIRGYIKFDAPGIYQIETWSNDGLDARIGGQKVGSAGDNHPCGSNQLVDVVVPSAGWYDLSMTYFQKYGTSCLMMKWGKDGEKLSWVPNNVFGYK
ncbi:hypothetical protein [Ruegeria arenilitoris]|uniref:hypothetical protein n=1 Tax=Ruegeria arenilitoris TaxID=1173585 RepID=UPI00147F655B|nr:hypothetical protein [Ruegeria arenilitoris]